MGDDFALKGKICCGNCKRQLRHEKRYGEMVFCCGYKRAAGKFSKCYGGYYREYSVNEKGARAKKTVFYAREVVNQGMQEMKPILQKGKKQLPKPPQGKQSLKQLMKQNAGVSNIEITEGNIKAFESTAKKYGIDFALKKDATESPPRYLVFFKGRDADVLTAAFKEFSAKKLTQEKKPSIRKLLSTLKEAAQGRNAERAKVKNKDREVSL